MPGDHGLGRVHLVIVMDQSEHSLAACSVSGVLSPSHAPPHVVLLGICEGGATVLLTLLVGRLRHREVR